MLTLAGVAQAPHQQQMALELLNNEKDFVISSQIHGLAHGFMQYTTDSSLGLNQKGINHVRDDWRQQKATNFSMVWKPVVVYAGADGLHGITSGPYYIKPATDSVLRKGGYFFSVWERKTTRDSFKLVSDCGIRCNTPSELDEQLVVMNNATMKSSSKPGNFTLFKQLATGSLANAIQTCAVSRHELLLSNYGVYIGGDEAKRLGILAQPATLAVEKEIDNTSLHIIIGKVSLATNPFPAEKKLQREGWFVQVWSKDKQQQGILATLLRF
jgi:hypothetical protein